MSDKLYLVEIAPAGAKVIEDGKVLVKAPSSSSARRVALDACLTAKKLEALEALTLSAEGLSVLSAEDEPSADEIFDEAAER